MNHVLGALSGMVVGAVLSGAWFALSWLWRHVGRDLVMAFVSMRTPVEGGMGLFEAVPAALGFAVYAFGLEWIGVRLNSRVPYKSFAWGAAVVCGLVTVLLAAFMFFLAYSSQGPLSFWMFLYAIAMLCLPLLGIRVGLKGARENA